MNKRKENVNFETLVKEANIVTIYKSVKNVLSNAAWLSK